MAKLLEDMAQGAQPGVARASTGRARRPSAKVQAMQDDHEQEKITQDREALAKAKKREERVRKRDQAVKAAQRDPLKSKPTQASATSVPTVVDKAFESRAAGGLGTTLTRASLAPSTLVPRKGNIPPRFAFPKSSTQTLPSRVRVSEPPQSLKLDSLSLNPTTTSTRKRARSPTPFPDREAADPFEDDFGSPPFTQKKRLCYGGDHDDAAVKVAKMVTHDVQSAVGDGESLTADSKLAVDKKQQAPQSQPAGLSHNAPGGEKTKNRPKAGDYDAATRRILETAIEFYHILLLSEDPFPESHVETDWAKGAWDMSCQYYKSTDASLNPALIRLITARSSNLRGQFKTKARSVVATSYGFEMGDGIATRERNRDLATELKFKSAFTFRELHPRRTGIYKNKAIQQAINEVLFKNKGDEGIKWAEYYDPFPRVAFALTLTAFECALDEWASGKRESIAFKEDSYKGIYIQHMKTLKYFHQQTEEFNILPAVLEQVYSNGRSYAGVVTVNPESDSDGAFISDDMIQDAIEEFGEEGGRNMDEITEGVAENVDKVKEGVAEDVDEHADDETEEE